LGIVGTAVLLGACIAVVVEVVVDFDFYPNPTFKKKLNTLWKNEFFCLFLPASGRRIPKEYSNTQTKS
jgi:hypothetical protein